MPIVDTKLQFSQLWLKNKNEINVREIQIINQFSGVDDSNEVSFFTKYIWISNSSMA